MTMVETAYQQEELTADDVYAAMLKEWDTYRPEPEDGLPSTEENLGLVRTELRQVYMPGRHKLFVQDESVQQSGAYKVNGMAWFVDKFLSEADGSERPKFYIGSAGNAGAALVHAASQRGLFVQVETPDNLVDSKRRRLEGPNSKVNAIHGSVEEATAAAEAAANADPNGTFVHAYNNFDVIVGQGLVAKRALRSLLQHDARGAVNLDRDNVRLLVQRGGGSLLTGFACALRELKDAGVVGDNVQLFQVRPEESHEKYDGLHVQAPGSYAQTVIDDPNFVAGTLYVNDVETGMAARDMAHAFYGKKFEPSGLAGVAGFKHLQHEEAPFTAVSILTGANYSEAVYEHFRDAPRKAQQAQLANFAMRKLDEVLDQPYKQQPDWQLTPHYYGRFPAQR